MPEGSLLTGVIGNANLANPVHRGALADTVINARRPFTAYPGITHYDFEGESNYNSLQVTLSRQTSKRLQYFATYTLSRTKGTLGDEYRNRDPFNPARTYGIRNEDRTHIFNLSWNAFLPDPVSESGNRRSGRASSTAGSCRASRPYASGMPIWLGFAGPAGDERRGDAYYGTPDIKVLTGPGGERRRARAGLHLRPASRRTRRSGERILDINCIGFPAFGEVGDVLPPYDLRTPGRMNHDITLFKNFAIKGDQKLQVRVGVFNIFNMAAATTAVDRNDINLTLETVCNVDGQRRAERRRRHRRQRLRPARRLLASRRTRSTTSAGSTSAAATGSSSSR